MSTFEKESEPVKVKTVDDHGYSSGVNGLPQPIQRKPWWKFGGKDQSFVSVNAGYARTVDSDLSSDTKLGSVEDLSRNVYINEDSKEIYKPIEGYEGAHRFDPELQWTPEEEAALVRSVSIRCRL
jgi:hypothetical protein